jgi:hypothetical protein
MARFGARSIPWVMWRERLLAVTVCSLIHFDNFDMRHDTNQGYGGNIEM